MAKKANLPADTNKHAKAIVDMVTRETTGPTEQDALKAAAAALGRKGGLIGGKARAKALTAKQRAAIAKKGADARWNKK